MQTIRAVFQTLAATVCLLSAPMALGSQPDWVGGDAKMYPGELYLVGRGSGSTEDEAQNRARGDLASIFEVRVEVVTVNTTTTSKSGNHEQVNSQASQQVSAKTDKVISGISIEERWRDPTTKTYYALAVLSRAQAGTSLREELARIDDNVQLEVTAANAASDPLLKIAALNRATEAAINRDGFLASLKVVNPSGHGIDAPISQAAVRVQMDDALKQIKIATEVKDDEGVKEFASILKGGVAATGFPSHGMGNADYLLAGKLTLTEMDRNDSWHWIRGTIEVVLVEKGTGRVRGSKTWSIKASAQDAKTARSRSLLEVEKLLKQELRSTIIGFASS